MKKYIQIIVIILLPFIGWAEPRGEVIFSVTLLEGSRTGIHTNKTGIFFYLDDQGPKYGSSVAGYQFKDGKIVDVFGGGTYGSRELLENLNSIKIKPFDCQYEIETTIITQKENAKKNGTKFKMPIVLDGAKYKIYYSHNDVTVSLTDWNPSPKVFYLAEFNGNLHQLKEVIDLFATYYGRKKMGL